MALFFLDMHTTVMQLEYQKGTNCHETAVDMSTVRWVALLFFLNTSHHVVDIHARWICRDFYFVFLFFFGRWTEIQILYKLTSLQWHVNNNVFRMKLPNFFDWTRRFLSEPLPNNCQERCWELYMFPIHISIMCGGQVN